MIKTIYPYLTMDGNAKEAITFYENALDAEVLAVQTFADMKGPMPIPDEAKDRILNAQLKVGDTFLMLSDTFPDPNRKPFEAGSQVTIALILNSVEKSKEVFKKLEDGGTVTMPLQETFWSPSYGQVKDKFGISWQVSTELEE